MAGDLKKWNGCLHGPRCHPRYVTIPLDKVE